VGAIAGVDCAIGAGGGTCGLDELTAAIAWENVILFRKRRDDIDVFVTML
jgi:hypothetical protein